MRRRLNYGLAVCALVAAGALHASDAKADIVTIYDAIPYGENITLYNITSLANPTVTVTAGQDKFTLTDNSTLFAWCMDLFHTVSLGANSYTFTEVQLQAGVTTDHATTNNGPHVLDGPTLSKMVGLMELGDDILQGGGLAAANAHYAVPGGDLNEWSAAVQLAIWDTEYQPVYGDLIWSGGTSDTLSIYTALVKDSSLTGEGVELLALGGQQSFGHTTYVPAPGNTLGLLGIGMIGTAGAIRWCRRRQDANTDGVAVT